MLYDKQEGVASQKGPRIIKLDDDDGKAKNKDYAPPKSLTVHLSKIDMPELRPRGTPFDRQQTMRRDHDSGKKKDKRGKAKDNGKDKDGRTKTLPLRQGTAPPHPVLHTHRSHYFQPTPSALSPSGPGPSYRQPPPLPSRPHVTVNAPQQRPPGTLRRQSMYAMQDRDDYDHAVQQHEGTSPGNNASTSGLLGRFLGR